MEKDTTDTQVMSMTSRDVLSDILRQGAQQMLAMAIENEVGEYIGEYQHDGCLKWLGLAKWNRTIVHLWVIRKENHSHSC